MNFAKELHALADLVDDAQIDIWESGFEAGLKAIYENIASRKRNNPKLQSISIESMIAIVKSERRTRKDTQ